MRPSAEFGRRVFELLPDVGKTKQDLMVATNSSIATVNRLGRGESSLLFAFEVKRLLKSWGADTSQLPPISDEDEGGSQAEDWLREWVELGKELHRLASEKRFQVEMDRVKEVIELHRLAAEGTGRHR
jgi:hypothetical protein